MKIVLSIKSEEDDLEMKRLSMVVQSVLAECNDHCYMKCSGTKFTVLMPTDFRGFTHCLNRLACAFNNVGLVYDRVWRSDGEEDEVYKK